MTEKLGLWPLFFQKCQHLRGVKVNALEFALFLEAAATVGSGLQLGGFTSELASSHHLAAPPEPLLAACWALRLCSACVFICSYPPRKTVYLWFHLHSLFGDCFRWMSVGKCFKWCIFPPSLPFFSMLVIWPGLCLALWLKRGEARVSIWIPRELFLEPWSKLKERFFSLIWLYSKPPWRALLFQQCEALANKCLPEVLVSLLATSGLSWEVPWR